MQPIRKIESIESYLKRGGKIEKIRKMRDRDEQMIQPRGFSKFFTAWERDDERRYAT